jgi:hypothetical protein
MTTMNPWSLGVSLIVAGSLVAVLAAGCAATPTDGDGDESSLDDADPGVSDGDEPSATVSSELAGCGPCNNCVLYARCRQRRLPFGLTSYADKVRHINSHTPHVGCVAVIRSRSSFGHVAYVNSLSGGRVHIDEANWSAGRCGTRSGTPSALHITGYICP